MAGVGISQASRGIQLRVEHGRVLAMLGAVVQKGIDARKHFGNVRGGRSAQERALQKAGQQRRTHALPRHVRNHQGPRLRTDRHHIVIIAAHLMRALARSANHEPALLRQMARHQTLLNAARHVEFFLDALFGALLFDQARVLENRRRFDRQRLQQLPIAARQIDRGNPRIHVEHAGVGLRHRKHLGRARRRSGSHAPAARRPRCAVRDR